jgi:SAM-dependent methyltransferase/aminoglycoside phosphotransferase (APT) family kinase protein
MTTEALRLLCPKCRATLPWGKANPLICSGCSTTYRVEDGIPIIRENDDYYHELLPREGMQELIRRSRDADWRIALAEQIAKAPERNRALLQTVFLDENRAAFKAILPPLDGRRVLDLGCGSGITSIGLARWAREVVSCDLTFERVAFLALRAQEMGLSNIRAICAGDTRPLPFPDASFDCVVLNGVLEWSAAEGSRPVRDGQLEFLGEVLRILQPDGHLYIGIENRYGYGYFFGIPEDHTGVKYAALAPRWLADVLVKRANGHPYRTYTYGYRGMHKLLDGAGFPSATFFAPIPDYRDFHELYPLDAPHSSPNTSVGGWRRRVKHGLERSRWFTPSFGVVASPNMVQKGWVEQLANELYPRLSIRDDIGFPKVKVSATSTAGLIVTLGRDAVVRVPLDPINAERVRRNFDGLERVQAVAVACNKFVAPQPLVSDKFHGASYTVESFVGGTPYADLSDEQKERGDRQVFDLLVELKAFRDPRSVPTSAPEVWRKLVGEPLRALLAQLSDGEDRRHLAILLESVDEGATIVLPVAFTHGDCWWGNILFDDSKSQLALIDWDRWAEQDFVTHDFLHFVCYRRVLRTNRKWHEAFSAWLNGTGTDPIEGDATHRFAERLALPDGWKPWAGLAYWVREVSGHHPSKLQLDPGWLRQIVGGALPALVKHVTAASRIRP